MSFNKNNKEYLGSTIHLFKLLQDLHPDENLDLCDPSTEPKMQKFLKHILDARDRLKNADEKTIIEEGSKTYIQERNAASQQKCKP